MNWDKEIEICGRSKRLFISTGELHSLLTWELSKDELEEFAGELIKFAELRAPMSLVSE